MDHHLAYQVVQALADGIDPESGEAFASESPYQRPDVIRALFVALRSMSAVEAQSARRAKLPQLAGKAWDDDEDARLRDGFAAKRPAAEIAQAHQRTAGAIRSRLVRLQLISERGDYP